ncbi:hypothetical protein PT2222_180130 [Paraburkholderia tropica]
MDDCFDFRFWYDEIAYGYPFHNIHMKQYNPYSHYTFYNCYCFKFLYIPLPF